MKHIECKEVERLKADCTMVGWCCAEVVMLVQT